MASKGKTVAKASPKLTHVDAAGHPAMVDVSGKPATAREARAECHVRFPAAVAAQLRQSDMGTAKGPVVDTAIIAGTMAVKRTHELIPSATPCRSMAAASTLAGARQPACASNASCAPRTARVSKWKP